jgi:LmbE family N-acetylglucosaminyl deacetylase
MAKKLILAIGAHCGDVEITTGAVLAKEKKLKSDIAILHMTLGERGHKKLHPLKYAEQKKKEALEAGKVLGAEVIFGPYGDGELPNNEEAVKFVSEVIRRLKPTHIITHWRRSIHKDHAYTHTISMDGTLLSVLEGVKSEFTPNKNFKGIYFTENWEDMDEFTPYIYYDISDTINDWERCVKKYELFRGGISDFPYFDYYKSLFRLRGCESGYKYACAFDIESINKKVKIKSF